MNFKKTSILLTLLNFNLLVYSVPIKKNNVDDISTEKIDSSTNDYIYVNDSPLEEEEELTELSDSDEIIAVTDSLFIQDTISDSEEETSIFPDVDSEEVNTPFFMLVIALN